MGRPFGRPFLYALHRRGFMGGRGITPGILKGGVGAEGQG